MKSEYQSRFASSSVQLYRFGSLPDDFPPATKGTRLRPPLQVRQEIGRRLKGHDMQLFHEREKRIGICFRPPGRGNDPSMDRSGGVRGRNSPYRRIKEQRGRSRWISGGVTCLSVENHTLTSLFLSVPVHSTLPRSFVSGFLRLAPGCVWLLVKSGLLQLFGPEPLAAERALRYWTDVRTN